MKNRPATLAMLPMQFDFVFLISSFLKKNSGRTVFVLPVVVRDKKEFLSKLGFCYRLSVRIDRIDTESIPLFDCPVAGVQYHEGPKIIGKLRVGA